MAGGPGDVQEPRRPAPGGGGGGGGRGRGSSEDSGGRREVGRHQTSRQRPQWAELTGEDELLLHHVDVAAGPPDGGAQHDLLGVVAAHAAGAVPARGRSQVRQERHNRSQSGGRGGASVTEVSLLLCVSSTVCAVCLLWLFHIKIFPVFKREAL